MQTDVQRGAGAKIPLSQFLQAMGFAPRALRLRLHLRGCAEVRTLHVAVRRSVVGSSAHTGAAAVRRSPFGRWIV